jgi:hypothetical protein
MNAEPINWGEQEKLMLKREKAAEAKENTSLMVLAAGLGLAAGTVLALRFARIQTIHVLPPPDIYAKIWKGMQETGKAPLMATMMKETILVPVEETA